MTGNQDLEMLSPGMREAVRTMDAENNVKGCWNAIREDYLDLARKNANLRNELELAFAECAIHEDACDRAEAELAAIKAKG